MQSYPAKDVFRQMVEQLVPVYGKDEAEAVIGLLFEDLLMLKKHQLSVLGTTLGEEVYAMLQQMQERLLKKEPVQQVLGHAYFYGLKFKVSRDVLVPRPETEELVGHVLDWLKGRPDAVLLDIGTGSGCIPVAIKKNKPDTEMYAIDVSTPALEIAMYNALLNKVNVLFKEHDILSNNPLFEEVLFDVIVSNPPYIGEEEKAQMHANVLEYEPHTALFVEGDDVLLFYKAISAFAAKRLKPGGLLFFEINEAYGRETADMMMSAGFTSVEIIKDMQGKDRMAKGFHI